MLSTKKIARIGLKWIGTWDPLETTLTLSHKSHVEVKGPTSWVQEEWTKKWLQRDLECHSAKNKVPNASSYLIYAFYKPQAPHNHLIYWFILVFLHSYTKQSTSFLFVPTSWNMWNISSLAFHRCNKPIVSAHSLTKCQIDDVTLIIVDCRISKARISWHVFMIKWICGLVALWFSGWFLNI